MFNKEHSRKKKKNWKWQAHGVGQSHTHPYAHTHPEEQSLSFSSALHHCPPMMLRSEAGNPSCTVSGWRSALLTPWGSGGSGQLPISMSLVHVLFQEHVGCVLSVVNKNGRAGCAHVDGMGAERVRDPSRCFWGSQNQVYVLMRSTDIWETIRLRLDTLFLFSAAGAVALGRFVFESSGCTFVWTQTNKLTLVQIWEIWLTAKLVPRLSSGQILAQIPSRVPTSFWMAPNFNTCLWVSQWSRKEGDLFHNDCVNVKILWRRRFWHLKL